MEHRWGERVAVRQTVELASGSLPRVDGLLENVSSSGAFVRTDGHGPPRGPVEVIMPVGGYGRRQSVRLPAYVVRETVSGVGIEWCEFAPRAIRELIFRDRRAGGGTRARARAQRSARYPGREPNTEMEPGAQSDADPAALGTNALPVTASAVVR